MSKKVVFYIISFFMQLLGFSAIWFLLGFKVCVALFILIWGLNLERAADKK